MPALCEGSSLHCVFYPLSYTADAANVLSLQLIVSKMDAGVVEDPEFVNPASNSALRNFRSSSGDKKDFFFRIET